ncbi:3-deoxy-D-manno-octulosonic acid transferase [Bombella sp. TMW 2.2559]|uniref:3-deoxy-D-manno-octulosonic acid transferase n=1 Tax=Bombella dulcis TaxID=2967339 RepID=A0ABT3WAK2_9PROT|nr:glycosyltransferase N-terminal domain-containing protein [Bombella dulcis]MCX5615833.1 3-deoxy-D-manno-octulosonic acid transferase [Bombella dulcis]
MRSFPPSGSSPDPVLWLWSLIGHILTPWLHHHAHKRARQGKEIRSRLPERFGIPGADRPPTDKPLVWFHAASVGESLCVLPVAEQLLKDCPELTILMTTATLTGAQTVTSHSATGTGRLIHQLIPYDAPHLLRRFLTYWQPLGLVLTESELWPGLLCLCQRTQLPVMLLNGRLSPRSAARWRLAAPLLRHLMRPLCWIMPRSTEDARSFSRFGVGHRLLSPADLKEDSPPLPADETEVAFLRQKIGHRSVFVAASTHPGEEEIIVEAVRQARETRPDLLTIIIPRHPERGMVLASQYHAPQRSRRQMPAPEDTLWIIDTLGELGLFFRLADRVLIGNSLCLPGGGHNPLESLRFQCPTAIGPYMQNWADLCTRHAASLHRIENVNSLVRWLLVPCFFKSQFLYKNYAISKAVRHIKDTVLPNKAHA